jgi:hypothetical protein
MSDFIKQKIGDPGLLVCKKKTFLCSRIIPASAVLKCYDWAIEQRNNGTCVISGFHSQLEKDVLHYLLKGTQPIILALARGIKKKIEPEFKKPLDAGRLLIITPFDETVTRVTEETARKRNEMMIEIADEVVVGYRKEGGQIDELLKNKNIKTHYL